MQDQIIYTCVLEVELNRGWMHQKMFGNFIRETMLRTIQKIESVKMQLTEPIEIIEKPSQILKPKEFDPSFSQTHLRLLNCSETEKQVVAKLREKFPHAPDNILIRYLTAKNWNVEEASKAYLVYVAWREEMKKYKLKDFQTILDKKIFTYLGKTHQGIPVIYNKAANVIPAELDQDLYVIFYCYFIEVYIGSKMKGNVDRIMVIADVEGLGTKNLKLSLTKKNVESLLKYCPERQSRLIGINANWFGATIWAMVKPMIPKKTLEKIQIFGSNKEEVFNYLIKIMDVSVIPDFLGGKNRNMWQDAEN